MAEHRGWRRIAGAGALACAVVAAAGCGGGGGDKSTSSAAAGGGDTTATTGTTSGSGGGKTFALLKVTWAPPDYMDPALAYTVNAWELMQNIYIGLLTYKHVNGPEGATIIPGMAQALPKVTNGGKTYSFTLRKGLKYSDGTPVKASDFEHTIKRLLFLGGPFSSFATSITGATKYQEAKKQDGDISGITADDAKGTITVNLDAPDSQFLYAAGLANEAPTPAAKSPFKKSNTIPGAGPYKISIQHLSRQFTLTKNKSFKVSGIDPGKIDKITVVKESVPKMTQDVIDGKLDFMTEDPTG